MALSSPEFRRNPQLLQQLTTNDSWIRAAYRETCLVGKEFARTTYDNQSLVARANKLQQDIVAALPPPGNSAQPRPVTLEGMEEFAGFVAANNGAVVVMRHGVQFIEEEERRKLSGAQKKINLMRDPFNTLDPADADSLAEAGGLALVYMQICQANEIPLYIVTSRNKRAAGVGAIISFGNKNQVLIDDRLTCVNYPNDISDEELNERLGAESMGALNGEPSQYDAVFGPGSFQTGVMNTHQLISELQQLPGLKVAITHSPQTYAVDVLTETPPSRMPELGCIVLGKTSALRLPHNIFAEK